MKEPNDGAWVRLCLPRAASKDTRCPGQGPPHSHPPGGVGAGGLFWMGEGLVVFAGQLCA